MIKKLRLRLILLVLSGLLLASAGVVFAINFTNWQNLITQANGILDMLADSGGQRPIGQNRGAFRDGNWKETPPPPPEGDTGDGRAQLSGGEGRGPFGEGGLPGERQIIWKNRSQDLISAASLSNFYTVQLDGQGHVTGWSSDRAEIYTDEEVEAMAQAAYASGKESGRVGTQFYRLTTLGEEKTLIVVDQRMEIQNAQDVLRLTVLVAVAEDALLSIGAVLLIRRMIRPVDEAIEKQKQFVWDASHELKTPLAVISANAEVLAGEVGPSKPLEYIQSEVQRTDHLVQNLLTLARMEKGTVAVEHKAFDLSRVVLSVALPFETAVFEAGKQMELSVPDGITCRGNEEMIQQLVVILLSNAEKYSDPGGKISVKLESRGEKRILQVHNTGPAIPREAQSKIFDRFYRVDSSHNREIPGNGLGLSIARSIVEMHRGKITVSSEEGKGTAFTVTL